jgi:RHS repeat-associated protein
MKYLVQQSSAGNIRLTNVNESGLKTFTAIGGNGTISTITPDSTITTLSGFPDPRFGLQSPVENSVTIRVPSSLQSTMSEGRLISQMTGQVVTGFKDSMIINGNISRMAYDGNQRLLTNTSPEGRHVYTRHDSLGHVIQDSIPGIVPTNYHYDSKGRIIETSQGGRTISYSYDTLGRVASVADPLLRITQFQYDSANRVTTQILPNGAVVEFSYDANGNIASVIPPGRPAHGFEYTANDLSKKYLPPYAGDSARSTTYQYNLDDRLTSITYPDSTMIQIAYDTISCSCGTLKGLPKSITFDRGQLLFSYDSSKGTLKRIISPDNDTLSYTYDGSLLTKETWGGNVNGNLQFFYDSNFRLIKEKVNGTDSTGFSYDKDGLLKTAGSLSIARNLQTGLITADTVGSVSGSRSYDSSGNLTELTYRYGGTIIFQNSYMRDSLSRIISQTETIQGTTKTIAYSYDSVGRVSTVQRNDTLITRYYYDTNGNRDSVWSMSGGTVRGTYDNQDRILTYGSAIFVYSKNGELGKKIEGTDTTKYTYDHFGNLTRVVLPNGNVIDYIIDGRNRRVGRKLNGSVVARWIYSGQLTIAAELDSSGDIRSRFIGSYMVRGDSTYRIVGDQIGSVRLAINVQTGTVAQRIDYDEFGNEFTNTNPSFTPFGFGRGLTDSQTGLVRFGMRDYDAARGRWTTKDPSGFRGGSNNLYEYAKNEPSDITDPTGLKICVGKARVLQGNAATIGKPGGFSTPKHSVPVTKSSAAVIPSQWGVDKAGLRPYLADISGKFSGGKSFTGLSDVIGGKSPDPNVNVRKYLQDHNPGNLILELPGLDQDLGTLDVELTVPDGLPCPAGTVERETPSSCMHPEW